MQALDETPELREMTSDWPVLDSMGITRHHEISHYVHRSLDGRNDVLRIFYKRSPGSLLPVTRKYEFGRAQKTLVADSGSARLEGVYEISPTLSAAIEELDRLLERSASLPIKDPAERTRVTLLEELDRLQDAVLGIASDEDAEILDERFASLRSRIETL